MIFDKIIALFKPSKPTLRWSATREIIAPTYGTTRAAGIDIYVPLSSPQWVLDHGMAALIPSGLRFNIPKGYALVVMNKSGVSSKKNLDKMAELVDEDYQGEVHINVINNGQQQQRISPGEKLVQLVLVPVGYAELVEVGDAYLFETKTARGKGGFGSTGV